MSPSSAQKWSEIFEILAKYENLIMLHYIIKKDEHVSAEELADLANITESKARAYLDDLCDEHILDREQINQTDHYKMTNGSQANFVEMIMRKIA